VQVALEAEADQAEDDDQEEGQGERRDSAAARGAGLSGRGGIQRSLRWEGRSAGAGGPEGA
jgi:hypothetical protein